MGLGCAPQAGAGEVSRREGGLETLGDKSPTLKREAHNDHSEYSSVLFWYVCFLFGRDTSKHLKLPVTLKEDRCEI